jgi:predicted methyltransferase
VCGVLAISLLYVGDQAADALRALRPIEQERDGWQRPADILRALDLKSGDTVIDLGSGVGYFSLKLSPIVGSAGTVVAADIRRESLVFLWIRTVLARADNIRIVHGEVDDPHLAERPADAVLALNTYHELANPSRILAVVFAHLKFGGRLVIVDRAPRAGGPQSREAAADHHEVEAGAVETELRGAGFIALTRDDRFIDRPDQGDIWWIVTARKP